MDGITWRDVAFGVGFLVILWSFRDLGGGLERIAELVITNAGKLSREILELTEKVDELREVVDRIPFKEAAEYEDDDS